MASITKTKSGYRAQIYMRLPGQEKPVRESRSFRTRREAVEWAAHRERELKEDAAEDPRLKHTLRHALRRYADEVSPTKRGERWEQVRLSAFESYKLPLDKPVLHVTAQDIADFRDTSMRWDQVFDRYCHLPQTKSGRPRDVPLSTRARALFDRMRGWDDELVFGLKAGTLDALFRKYRARAGLEGFTWHDTRHTAATMISRRVDVLNLCKIFGWADPKMAMVYYNPHAETLADLLD